MRSSRPKKFPDNYDDSVELNKKVGCWGISIPVLANIMFVGTVLSFIGYLVTYAMMAGSLSNANNNKIQKRTGDLSETLRTYQRAFVCDDFFETPKSVWTWFVFAGIISTLGIILRLWILYFLNKLAFSDLRTQKVRKYAFIGLVLIILCDSLEIVKFSVGRVVSYNYQVTRYQQFSLAVNEGGNQSQTEFWNLYSDKIS